MRRGACWPRARIRSISPSRASLPSSTWRVSSPWGKNHPPSSRSGAPLCRLFLALARVASSASFTQSSWRLLLPEKRCPSTFPSHRGATTPRSSLRREWRSAPTATGTLPPWAWICRGCWRISATRRRERRCCCMPARTTPLGWTRRKNSGEPSQPSSRRGISPSSSTPPTRASRPATPKPMRTRCASWRRMVTITPYRNPSQRTLGYMESVWGRSR
mmetsp:Transcript_11947/g.39264  ORF Transcript_11947/g.39264 Transcript_11947/m.39264 type:complete len:217 (+) Transcript_11947:244-894(+)